MSKNSSRPGAIETLIESNLLAAAGEPLERASTLPSAAFASPEVYALETARIFEREWLCAGRVDQIPDPGDYFSLDLIGEKIVVVRGKGREIRALSRICRHRAAEVVQGAGKAQSFQCPYHAWTYGLDGELIGAPHMEGVEGFERADCGLSEIRSEVWEGWIFLNFDPDAEALDPRLAPLARLLANYKMSERVAVETATFESAFNWKVLVDNFMEAYHHIAIHRDTLEPLFPAALSKVPESEGPYSVLLMPAKPGSEVGSAPTEGALPHHGRLTEEEHTRLVAAVIYPFHLFAPTADSLIWYQIIPDSFEHFTLKIYVCFPEETLATSACKPAVEGMQEWVRHIHRQDIEACEAVWGGLRTKSFESGRLSPLEKSIWQFNQWWLARMTNNG